MARSSCQHCWQQEHYAVQLYQQNHLIHIKLHGWLVIQRSAQDYKRWIGQGAVCWGNSTLGRVLKLFVRSNSCGFQHGHMSCRSLGTLTLLIACSCWCLKSACHTLRKSPFDRHSLGNTVHLDVRWLYRSCTWKHMAATCNGKKCASKDHLHVFCVCKSV